MKRVTLKRYKQISSGIYCIVNLFNGMMYIGSAINLRRRETEHLLALNKGIHPNRYLQAAWNKYWSCSFEFKILQVYDELTDLVELEQEWMNWLNSVAPNGYNLRPLAASNLGIKKTDEMKQAMSEIKTGTKASADTKLKMSETRKGRKQNPEWIAKRTAANIGRVKTQDQIDLQKAAIRDFDKWPHAKGCNCRCDECKDRHNQMKRLTAFNRKAKRNNW